MKIKKICIVLTLLLLLLSIPGSLIAAEHWFLLDSSASLNNEQARLRNLAAIGYADIILQLYDRDNIGVIDFSDHISILRPSRSQGNIKQFINGIDNNGNLTDIESALKYFETNEAPVRRKIYLFTDGNVDVSPARCIKCPMTSEDTASERNITGEIIPSIQSQKHKTEINVIALGNRINDKFINNLAQNSGGAVRRISSMSEMLDALTDLWQSDSRSPNVVKRNNLLSIDNGFVRFVSIVGSGDLKVIPPNNIDLEDLEISETVLPAFKKRIVSLRTPPRGTY